MQAFLQRTGIYISREPSGLLLQFKKVRMEDAGLYTCKGTINGATSTKSFTLEINENVKFVDVPSSQRIVLNREGFIKCVVTGSPSPRVTWDFQQKDSNTIVGITSGSKYQFEEGGLRITNVTSVNEEGFYNCKASQPELAVLDSRRISVEVIVPPVWKTKPKYTEGVLMQEYGPDFGKTVTTVLEALLIPVVEVLQQSSVALLPDSPVIKKNLDSNIVVTCEAPGVTSQDQVDFQWYLGSDIIPEREITSTVIPLETGIYISREPSGLLLQFKKVRMEDAGLYTCKGTINGATSTKSFTLEINENVKFVDVPSSQRIVLNREGFIKCVVTGSPSPRVTWDFQQKDSNTIVGITSGSKYQFEEGGLRITNVTSVNEEGFYNCKASQPELAVLDSRRISVEVIVPPVWKTKPKYTEGVLMQEVKMFCNATGKPKPSYTWYKGSSRDSTDFRDISQESRISMYRESGELVIRNIQRLDEGPYTCEAVVDLGDPATPDDDVLVSGTANLKVVIPAMIERLENKTVKKGDTVDLFCSVIGDRPMDISFHKVGNAAPYVYPTQASDSRITLEKSESGEYTSLKMTITATKEDDRGNYTCFANNTGGFDRRNGTIIVHYKPTFVKMKVPDVKYHWLASQPFKRNLTCIVEAEPLPGSWIWFRNNLPITPNETYEIHNMGLVSNLSVTVLSSNKYWVFGDYRCNASNDYGRDSHEIRLNEATVPGPPASIDVLGSTPTTVQLSVSTPLNQGGPPVSGYFIVFGTSDAGDEKTSNFNLGDEIVIRDLRPDTAYNIRVMAVNEVGQGDPKEIESRTLEVSVPEPVSITSPKNSPDSDKYTVAWDRPQNGGSVIESYTIKYRTVEMEEGAGDVPNVKPDSEGEWKTVEVLRPERRVMTLTQLNPDSWYEVQVLANNNKGASEGQSAFFKTMKDPYQPTDGTEQPNTTLSYAAENTTLSLGNQSTGSTPSYTTPIPIGTKGAAKTGASKKEGLSTGAIIGIVIAIFFVLLIILDVSCYFINNCGVLMCMCTQLCGKKTPADPAKHKKAADVEKGTGDEKQNLKDDMETADQEDKKPDASPEEVELKEETPNEKPAEKIDEESKA
ncbi:neural cell adhesion molecule 2 [Lingula anatina]|uniref:Neural cell adhesion molecule 2 n=1 Tax=Lingula anatina TaxID=7574 RepID=A0A1S3HSH8_LINAN|nr:neural cell adhesion molecule 2 [Lingula anatina]|eukprot:XP_013388014.1 neural cell adhesion molecule 2 [Lingula anatina]